MKYADQWNSSTGMDFSPFNQNINAKPALAKFYRPLIKLH